MLHSGVLSLGPMVATPSRFLNRPAPASSSISRIELQGPRRCIGWSLSFAFWRLAALWRSLLSPLMCSEKALAVGGMMALGLQQVPPALRS